MGIGANVKARREELGMTQEELANKLGYKSRSTINKIELGINDVTQTKVALLAKALDTTPAKLLGWENDISSKSEISILPQENISLIPRQYRTAAFTSFYVDTAVLCCLNYIESVKSLQQKRDFLLAFDKNATRNATQKKGAAYATPYKLFIRLILKLR